jgi:hypothetical protein
MDWLARLFQRVASKYYRWRFQSLPAIACIRVKVRRGKWKDKSPDSAADLHEAIKDLEVKPKDNGALSVYFVRSKREARRIGLIHQVTNNTPNEGFTFLFVPASCLLMLSSQPRIVRQLNLFGQHPLLNKHHFVVYGMTDEKTRLELAAAILRHPNHAIECWTKQQVKRRARIIARKWTVRRFMHSEQKWQNACYGSSL